MNAVTKVITQGAIVRPVFIPFSLQAVWAFILFCMVFATALGVVYIKDLNRRLFISYQELQSDRNDLTIEYGKLLLEESAYSGQARIQKVAIQKLDMKIPRAKDITLIRL